jgi:hypothetical protein
VIPLPTALLIALCCAAQPDAAPRFTIHGADGALPPAAIAKLAANWSLWPTGGKSLADWTTMQQDGRPRPAPLAPPFILLGSGDRLPIQTTRPIQLDDGRLRCTPGKPLRTRTGTELSLYRPYVALLMLAVPDGVDEIERLVTRLQREPRDDDLVLLRNGDRIQGAVERLSTKDGCEVTADGAKIVTPWPKLAGIAFATKSLARPRPQKLHALAVLDGGARVHFASLALDAAQKRWSGRTTTGADLTFAEPALVALDLLRGRAFYLSSVPPLAYKQTPYLGVRWPLGMDATPEGRQLRVGADTFDKGLSVHGQARVSYWLDGKFAWFEATVGLDPTAGPKGRARLAVFVDGKRHVLAGGKELTADDAPLPVRIDVRGAQSLMLVVDNGSLGDVQARVNWGGARLLRSAR